MTAAHYAHIVIAIEPGHNGIQLTRKLCLSKYKVYLAHYVKIFAYFVGIRRKHCRKLRQYALYFVGFFRKQLFVFIAEFDYRRRFNEQRCAAAALVVYKPGNLLAIFLLNWDYKAAVAYCYYRLLEIFLVCSGAYHAVQLFAHFFVGKAHGTAYACKRGRCPVEYLVLIYYAAVYFFLCAPMGNEQAGKVIKIAFLPHFIGKYVFGYPCRFKAACYAQQFAG